MKHESLRNFLMRFISLVTEAVSDKDISVPPIPFHDVLLSLTFAIDLCWHHLSLWVADWWRLIAAKIISHFRSSATETSNREELSKQSVHTLIQLKLASADTSFGGFEPTHARRA
jgi:hypothetical protein